MEYFGYIYHIINTKNNKYYIGKTFDIEHRLYNHFYDLENQQHHSQKLQRAYNLYGKDAFLVEYQIIKINNEEELALKEIEEINKYDSYKNGYNETLGGDGNKLSIDLFNSILIYNICQNYKGVNRQIAKYFNCDHSVIDNLSKNNLFKNQPYNQIDYNNLINKIGISENNKNENYIPHNIQKLDKEKCLELLSVITQTNNYEKTMCEIFNINSKLTWRLKQGLIYKDYYDIYQQMSIDKKQNLLEETLKKYNVKSIYANRQRRCVKNPLTQEQVNYILKNKNIKSKAQIGRDLNISVDRVRGICNGTSYKDLIDNYYSSIN